MNKFFAAALLPLLFMCAINANAQVFTNPIPPQINISNQIWRNFRMGQIGNQIAADMARSNAVRKTQKGKSASNPKVAAPVLNYSKVLSFPRASSSPLAEKFSQLSNSNSSLNSEQFNTLLARLWADYEKSFSEENTKLKMPYNDVATVMTYFISINYMSSRDLSSLEVEKSIAVYKQISDVLLKNPDFMKAGSVEKQMMAEVLVMLGGIPGLTFNQNRNFSQLKSMSDENLSRIFGAKASDLKITENGIEF